jgi:hypothetical protein
LIAGIVAFQMVDGSIITCALFRFLTLTNTFSPFGENARNSPSEIATLTLPLFFSISAHTSAALTSRAVIWYV